MAEYRIIPSKYAGHKVQVRRWWWPFWESINDSIIPLTLEEAIEWAKMHAKTSSGENCVYLGKWSGGQWRK
jgi:hypothetical protein